jgi:hypothetical protein
MNDIKKYIDQEKGISRFKLEILEKINKPYKKRAVLKEKRFLSFNFLNCNFKDIDEARYALDLFRSSEIDFYEQYGIEVSVDSANLKKMCKFLKEKKGDAICNKFSYIDYLDKKTANSDGSIKKVICDRNIFLSDFLSYVIKNINMLSSGIRYLDFRAKIIKDMFDDGKMQNCIDIFREGQSNFHIEKKTETARLIVTSIPHKGNEKMIPVGCRVKALSGYHTISKFNNIKNNGNYIKVLKINDDNIDDMEDIHLEDSYCIVFETRRSSESFSQIEKNIKIILKDLSEKFKTNIAF